MLADTFPTFKVAVVCDNMDEKSHKKNIQAKKKRYQHYIRTKSNKLRGWCILEEISKIVIDVYVNKLRKKLLSSPGEEDVLFLGRNSGKIWDFSDSAYSKSI